MKGAASEFQLRIGLTRFFVTRAKRNFRFRYLDSRRVDRTTGVHSDQTVRLYGFYSKQSYPERLLERLAA